MWLRPIIFWKDCAVYQSFIKRQTSDLSSDNEWQRVVECVTRSDNEWQRVTASDSKWQRVVVFANFSFSRIIEEPTTMHPKDTY